MVTSLWLFRSVTCVLHVLSDSPEPIRGSLRPVIPSAKPVSDRGLCNRLWASLGFVPGRFQLLLWKLRPLQLHEVGDIGTTPHHCAMKPHFSWERPSFPYPRYPLAFPVSPSCPTPVQRVLPCNGDCSWKSCDTDVSIVTWIFQRWLQISSVCTIRKKRKQTK